jgi:hypothetical protein
MGRRMAVGWALAAGAVAALALGTSPVRAAAPVTGPPSDAQLTFDRHYAEGEPSVAVNPKDPSNIIVTFLADTFLGFPALANGQAPTTRSVEQPIQGCDYVVTFDGGQTWTRHTLPIAGFDIDPTRTNCSDTIVSFDQAGVAHVMGASYNFPGFVAGLGDFRMINSTDGGRTWSKPVVISPTIFSPGADPAGWRGLRFYDDRPFMAIDDSSGTIYVNGTQGRVDASGTAGDIEYLTASRDGGQTWGDAIAVGTASASPLGAAFGTVAFTSPPPAGATRACSCLDLVVSTDAAHSYVRRPSPIPSGAGLFGASTAADPTHAGSFAVLTTDSAGNAVVYRTPNAGLDWSGPTAVPVPGTTVNQPWVAFSPTGILGAGWKATAPDGSYTYVAAVSSDGGATFGAPVRISSASSPPPSPYVPAGDDTTSIALTADRLYAAWGDWRGGSLQTWWGGFGVGP